MVVLLFLYAAGCVAAPEDAAHWKDGHAVAQNVRVELTAQTHCGRSLSLRWTVKNESCHTIWFPIKWGVAGYTFTGTSPDSEGQMKKNRPIRPLPHMFLVPPGHLALVMGPFASGSDHVIVEGHCEFLIASLPVGKAYSGETVVDLPIDIRFRGENMPVSVYQTAIKQPGSEEIHAITGVYFALQYWIIDPKERRKPRLGDSAEQAVYLASLANHAMTGHDPQESIETDIAARVVVSNLVQVNAPVVSPVFLIIDRETHLTPEDFSEEMGEELSPPNVIP